MLDLSILEKIDTQKMYVVYDRWPEIARESFESDQDSVNFDGINHIVFAGMGGSGTIGDVFASILSKSKMHVNVVKGYALPETVDSDTLVVVTSVSGDSTETLSVLESAHKLNCKIIAFTSGGKMLEFCAKNKIQHRIVPQHHSPRASLTSYLYTVLKILHFTLGIKQEDILESITELENLNKKINSSNLTDSNPSLDLAEWVTNIPMIYYPFGLQSAAIRFKNSLQENAKTHAMTEDILETCHNGIVSWEKKSSVQPILIEGQEDHFKTKQRWNIVKEFLSEINVDYFEIKSISGNILSKIITLIYLLDYSSIYFAVLSGTDPTPIKSIDFVKKKL